MRYFPTDLPPIPNLVTSNPGGYNIDFKLQRNRSETHSSWEGSNLMILGENNLTIDTDTKDAQRHGANKFANIFRKKDPVLRIQYEPRLFQQSHL